jgi:hypothetical protein
MRWKPRHGVKMPDPLTHHLVGTYGWSMGSTEADRQADKAVVLRVDQVLGNYRVKGTTSCGHQFATSIGKWKRDVDPATAEDWERSVLLQRPDD